MRSTISLLSIRGYSSFLGGRISNSIALWVDFTLIFSLLSFHYRASPAVLGVSAALYGLPGLLLGPLVGAMADRKSPALIMLLSAFARFATSIGLLFADNETMFIAWVFIKGLGNVGTIPAEQVLMRRLLSSEQIVSAVALVSVVDQCSKILSPLIGAGLSFALHSTGGFALTAILAIISAVCAIRVARVVGWHDSDEHSRRLYPDFKLIRQVMTERPALAWSLALVLTFSVILGLYDSVVAILLRDRGLPDSSFGTIVSCTALGAIGCAIMLKNMLARVSASRFMIIFLAGFSASVVAAGLLALALPALSLGLLCVVWGINGFCYAGGVMAYSIALQREAPPGTLGVVSASARSLQLAALVIGPIVGSWVAQAWGLEATFVGAGGLGLAIASYAALKQARVTHIAARPTPREH